MIKAEIVADSINEFGNRITTFVVEYPRFFHADMLRHRAFSFSSSSSRATPTFKMLKMIWKDMAMPSYWGKNQSGMKARTELSNTRIRLAKLVWVISGYFACAFCWLLNKIGLHKQHTNRIIEPYGHIKHIITSTDYKNFFALRNSKDSQPEFQILAQKMQDALDNSVPELLKAGEWHIPDFSKLKP